MQIHGGDIYKNQVDIDFSANINPLGTPKSVTDAAIEGVYACSNYPDVECSKLKEAIASTHQVPKEWVYCGNGAAEVIFSLVLAKKPKKALLLQPTFHEYEQALRSVACEVEFVTLKKDNGFAVTKDILVRLRTDLDLVFLCNPNNPTGELVNQELMLEILKKCEELNILLVVDECFMDFVDEDMQASLISCLRGAEHLFILKAFTKMYGMAGLRLGYGLCQEKVLLDEMNGVTQPWNVSTPAQLAGIAALSEMNFENKTRRLIQKERKYLRKELIALGFRVYGSKANYLFFQGNKSLYEECLEHRILIRSCANYQGLDETYYRIAVKNHEQNQALIELLKEIVVWQK